MANVVGSKGQVVIAREIRTKLGVQPGWVALQRLVDDHVEIFFVPPAHRQSLRGSLARYARNADFSDDDWREVKEAAWKAGLSEAERQS